MMIVTGGATDVTTYFSLRLASTGAAATGLTITDLDLQYVRTGAAPVAKVDATALAATDSAHADNKAIEIDATDQPGLYRVDWPDAAFAAGVREAILSVKHSTTIPADLRVLIDPFGAPAGATLAADIAAVKTDTAAILVDTGTDGVVVASGSKTGYALTSGERTSIADALLDRDMSTGTDSGSSTVRTVRQALRMLRNKVSRSGTTLTVHKEDDSTASFTATLTTDASAEPITAIDPAGP